jgi:hypothetical protein
VGDAEGEHPVPGQRRDVGWIECRLPGGVLIEQRAVPLGLGAGQRPQVAVRAEIREGELELRRIAGLGGRRVGVGEPAGERVLPRRGQQENPAMPPALLGFLGQQAEVRKPGREPVELGVRERPEGADDPGRPTRTPTSRGPGPISRR